MNDHVMRWARVLGISMSFALLPMAFSEFVLYRFALASGQAEVDAMADSYLHAAEGALSDGIRQLTALRNQNEVSCEPENLQAFADSALASPYIQEVGLVDSTGLIMCGAPASSQMRPLRLPALSPADPVVTIGVVSQDDEVFGRVVVSLRVDNVVRLIARLRPNVLDFSTGPVWLQAARRVQVLLSDGSEWPLHTLKWDPGMTRVVVSGTANSTDYPLHVRISASGDAMFLSLSSLRFIMLAAALFLGTVSFAVTFWLQWSGRYADDEFQRAVANREFVPWYQPVMDITTGQLLGCEMLVRWVRPDGTIVPPGSFLPYSEATGLIRDITRNLMQQTVDDLADLYRQLPALKLSVNLTASHFIDMEIVPDVEMIYGHSGIKYEQLMFEVTEQHPLKDIGLAKRVIRRLQELGARVALDDVGTGHGSLAYIQKLGVDVLKIDKMFVDGLGRESQSEKIVTTVVDLANSLGMGVIAEGVEDENQLDYLKRLGVTVAQGYVFARPLPIDAYREMIERLCADELALAADARAEAAMAEAHGPAAEAA